MEYKLLISQIKSKMLDIHSILRAGLHQSNKDEVIQNAINVLVEAGNYEVFKTLPLANDQSSALFEDTKPDCGCQFPIYPSEVSNMAINGNLVTFWIKCNVCRQHKKLHTSFIGVVQGPAGQAYEVAPHMPPFMDIKNHEHILKKSSAILESGKDKSELWVCIDKDCSYHIWADKDE